MPRDINVDGKKGKLLNLPTVKNAPDSSVMKLEATIENPGKQKLKKIRPFEACCLRIPGGMPTEGQMVLKCLFDIFEKHGSVQEGQVKDLIWGFQQSAVHPGQTIKGLQDLMKAGYISLEAPDNTPTDFSSDLVVEAFVRYKRPLLEMVYEGGTTG